MNRIIVVVALLLAAFPAMTQEKWTREGIAEKYIDLSGIVLRFSDLAGQDLSLLNLSDADLAGVVLRVDWGATGELGRDLDHGLVD